MKVSFPVASIFGALLTIFQTVNLIWRYVVTGYPVIPFTLGRDIISILCMGVLTAGLFLRQRNVMITGPLLLQSLGSLFFLVSVILDTVFHIRLIFPGFFRATLDWIIGLTGYALTGFLSWFFLLITAVNCFNDPDSRELKGSRLFWAAPGWLGFIHTLGRLIGASVLGGFPGGLISLFLEVPFLFLLGWWLTHPYAAPPQAALKYTAMQAASQQRQGYALPAAPQAPGYERPAAPQPVHAAFCPFCGQKLEPQHAFCPACGSRRPVRRSGYSHRGTEGALFPCARCGTDPLPCVERYPARKGRSLRKSSYLGRHFLDRGDDPSDSPVRADPADHHRGISEILRIRFRPVIWKDRERKKRIWRFVRIAETGCRTERSSAQTFSIVDAGYLLRDLDLDGIPELIMTTSLLAEEGTGVDLWEYDYNQ